MRPIGVDSVDPDRTEHHETEEPERGGQGADLARRAQHSPQTFVHVPQFTPNVSVLQPRADDFSS